MHLSVPHRYNRSAVFLWKIKAPLPQVYNKREKPLPDHKTTENSAIDLMIAMAHHMSTIYFAKSIIHSLRVGYLQILIDRSYIIAN